MRLSFLIQLLLLIILIVGVYLIFTNGVSGRNKLILIVFLVVIGIYLFNKLPFLRVIMKLLKILLLQIQKEYLKQLT